MKTFRLPPAVAGRLAGLAAARFGGNETAAVTAAIEALAAPPALPTLAEETWDALTISAKGRLRRALREADLLVCLVVTRDWWVAGMDAHLIDVEIEAYRAVHGEPSAEWEATLDALFGPDIDVDAIPGANVRALVGTLRAMPDFDRAVLTLACREWWDTDPRPPLSAVLGGLLRGPRSN